MGQLGATAALAAAMQYRFGRPAFLMREGCPLAQGFLLGAPAPPEAFEELMRGPLVRGPLRALS